MGSRFLHFDQSFSFETWKRSRASQSQNGIPFQHKLRVIFFCQQPSHLFDSVQSTLMELKYLTLIEQDTQGEYISFLTQKKEKKKKFN